MPKPTGPLTEEEQLEVDLQLEADLILMQRQYKILDGQLKKGDPKVLLQRSIMSQLKRENLEVGVNHGIATSSTKKKIDIKIASQLRELLDQGDFYNMNIIEKTKHLREIDSQITKLEKNVILISSKQPTDTQIMDRLLAGQNTVDCLENKLDSQVKKFCTISTENRHLREEIEHLLIERKNVNLFWEMLIGNLSKGNAFMLDLVQQATVAYNQRDEWCTKLHVLRTRAYTDLISQTQEMTELQRKLCNNKKIEEFMSMKGQKREMQQLEKKKLKKIEEARFFKAQRMDLYRHTLKQILNFSSFTDIHDLAKLYAQKQEENFSRFNYFNVAFKEVEDIADYLVDMYEKIDAQAALTQARTMQQKDNLTKMTANLKQTKREADMRQGDINKTRAKLQKLYTGIEKLFKICQCSNAPFLQLLGDNAKINDYNVLLYLQLLEGKIGEMISRYYYKQLTAKGAASLIMDNLYPYKSNKITAIVPTNPCPLCVEQEQVSDIIDQLQFIQEQPEVKRKLAERLMLPDGLERLHNVSACHLPKSRQIIQKRFQ